MVTVVAARETKGGQDGSRRRSTTRSVPTPPGDAGRLLQRRAASRSEILTCRLIERPIRPLSRRLQTSEIIATVMSRTRIDSDIPEIGASAALASPDTVRRPDRRRAGWAMRTAVHPQTHRKRAQNLPANWSSGHAGRGADGRIRIEELPKDACSGRWSSGTSNAAASNMINELAMKRAIPPGMDAPPRQALIDRMAQMTESELRQAYQPAASRNARTGWTRARCVMASSRRRFHAQRAHHARLRIQKPRAKIVRNRFWKASPQRRQGHAHRGRYDTHGRAPARHATARFPAARRSDRTATIGTRATSR